MKAKIALLGAAALVAMADNASAGAWYVAADAGINWIDDADVSGTFLGAPTTGTISFDAGWTVSAAVGKALGSGWRVEGQVSFQHNDTTSNFAWVEDVALMVNVLYDFELSPDFDLSLGGGVGVDQAKFNVPSFTSDTDTNFALQIIAGVSYALSPEADLTLTYRYLGVIDPVFNFGQAATTDFDGIRNRGLAVGVRWRL